jgi:2-polyprenyl-3-methyl-5-hydroxy-6-metoxy-1,4-benzoquinol methylase
VSYATLSDLRSQLGKAPTRSHSPEYAAKMLHALPPVQVVDRREFVLSMVTGKRVLEFGASGPMSEAVQAAAKDYLGVDRTATRPGVVAFDLDDVFEKWLPSFDAPDVIVCGEVLEHLSNPGWFLARLRRRYAGVPVLITVPNAFSSAAASWLAKGFENVNRDHVAWYSPKTLSVLLTRAGYRAGSLYYYNGHGPTAEGLVVVAES